MATGIVWAMSPTSHTTSPPCPTARCGASSLGIPPPSPPPLRPPSPRPPQVRRLRSAAPRLRRRDLLLLPVARGRAAILFQVRAAAGGPRPPRHPRRPRLRAAPAGLAPTSRPSWTRSPERRKFRQLGSPNRIELTWPR